MIFGAAGAQNGHRAGPRVGSPDGLRDGLSSGPRDEPVGDVDFSGVDPVGLITEVTQYPSPLSTGPAAGPSIIFFGSHPAYLQQIQAICHQKEIITRILTGNRMRFNWM